MATPPMPAPCGVLSMAAGPAPAGAPGVAALTGDGGGSRPPRARCCCCVKKKQ